MAPTLAKTGLMALLSVLVAEPAQANRMMLEPGFERHGQAGLRAQRSLLQSADGSRDDPEEENGADDSDAVREAKEGSNQNHEKAHGLISELDAGYKTMGKLLQEADHQASTAKKDASVWATEPVKEFEKSKERVQRAVTVVNKELHENHAAVVTKVHTDVQETLDQAKAAHASLLQLASADDPEPEVAEEEDDAFQAGGVAEAHAQSEEDHQKAHGLMDSLRKRYSDMGSLLKTADSQVEKAKKDAHTWATKPVEEFTASKKKVVTAVESVAQALKEGHSAVAQEVHGDVQKELDRAADMHAK